MEIDEWFEILSSNSQDKGRRCDEWERFQKGVPNSKFVRYNRIQTLQIAKVKETKKKKTKKKKKMERGVLITNEPGRN